jgi:hypothetical protein
MRHVERNTKFKSKLFIETDQSLLKLSMYSCKNALNELCVIQGIGISILF